MGSSAGRRPTQQKTPSENGIVGGGRKRSVSGRPSNGIIQMNREIGCDLPDRCSALLAGSLRLITVLVNV